jgi:histidyl-tRNA synthetase
LVNGWTILEEVKNQLGLYRQTKKKKMMMMMKKKKKMMMKKKKEEEEEKKKKKKKEEEEEKKKKKKTEDKSEKQVTSAVACFNSWGASVCSDNIRHRVGCQEQLLLLAFIHCKVI